jgi:hypothetical protein
MSEQSIFTVEGERFVPTAYARGPWDPNALHGGAAAALVNQELERRHPTPELRTGRLSFQFLRPVPSAPLTLSSAVTRPGRRVQELSAELHAGELLVCRAKALRVQPVPDGLPIGDPDDGLTARAPGHDTPARDPRHGLPDGDPGDGLTAGDPGMPGPDAGEEVRFALDDAAAPSFATAMRMRWLTEPFSLGPGNVWMRLSMPLLPGRPASPLSLLAAVADFGNGVSSELRFDRYLFVNADLTLHLHRPPDGEWAGIAATTLLSGQGPGLAQSVLHDAAGPVGSAFQTLVVQQR